MTGGACITFVVASIRPHALRGLLDHLERTALEPGRIEVLIKIDEEDAAMLACKRAELGCPRRLAVHFFVTPRGEGYWSLYKAYNEMIASHPSTSYFIFPVNDQLRFADAGWDAKMLSYAGRFGDDVFHLRLSPRRRMKFASIVECLSFGESFAVFTRGWIRALSSLAVGTANVDSGLECVHFFLRRYFGVDRGVPVDDIRIDQESRVISPFVGLTALEAEHKMRKIYLNYAEHLSLEGCRGFYALARSVAMQISPQRAAVTPEALCFADWFQMLFEVQSMVKEFQADWSYWPPLIAARMLARRIIACDWLERRYQKPCAEDYLEMASHLSEMNKMRNRFGYTSILQEAEVEPLLYRLGLGRECDFFCSILDLWLEDASLPGADFVRAALLLYCPADHLALKSIDTAHLLSKLPAPPATARGGVEAVLYSRKRRMEDLKAQWR
jgi:hypothetical protein